MSVADAVGRALRRSPRLCYARAVRVLAAVLTLTLLHLVVGWRALQGGLLADDFYNVWFGSLAQDHPWSFRWWFLFWRQQHDLVVAHWRPLTALTYVLEYPWWGVQAFGYHLVNSAMHVGTAVLLMGVMRRLGAGALAAFAGAALFVGHPVHGEATHWIAARVDLLPTLLGTLAVWCLLAARRGGIAGVTLLALSALVTALALCSKESAVLLPPILWLLAALDPAGRQWNWPHRGLAALRTTALHWLVLLGYLAVRWHVLGTLGAGRGSGPTAAVLGDLDRLWVLVAPIHRVFTPEGAAVALWVLHGILLLGLLAAAARRNAPGALRLLAWAAVTLAAAWTLPWHAATLENGRHLYQPMLPLAALLGLGCAALPRRLGWPVLIATLLAHAWVLDHNRENWLRAAAIRERVRAQSEALVAAGADPVWVLDVPATHHGAFVRLGERHDLLPPFAPPGLAERLRWFGESEWQDALRLLAESAAAGAAPARLFQAGWDDGVPRPFELESRWPVDVSGCTVHYARIARALPHLGTSLPVDVQLTAPVGCRVAVLLRREGEEPAPPPAASADVPAGAVPAAVRLEVPLGSGLRAGEQLRVDLQVSLGPAPVTMTLGTFRPLDAVLGQPR